MLRLHGAIFRHALTAAASGRCWPRVSGCLDWVAPAVGPAACVHDSWSGGRRWILPCPSWLPLTIAVAAFVAAATAAAPAAAAIPAAAIATTLSTRRWLPAPHARAMNGHLRRDGVRSASAVVASGRASTRSYHSRRTSTPGTRATRTETATAATAEEPSYMVALIENRAREVGLALYRLRSFHVELRQYCDSNSFSTTLAALAVSAYVSLRRWHGTLGVRNSSLVFHALSGCGCHPW